MKHRNRDNQEAFQELVQLWQKITHPKSRVKSSIPDKAQKEIESLTKSIQKFAEEAKELQVEQGIFVENPKDFVENNRDLFNKEDLQLMVQIERMKDEISSVQEELIKISQNPESTTSKEAPMDLNTEEKKEDRKAKSKRIRKRMKKFRGTGNGDWIPM